MRYFLELINGRILEIQYEKYHHPRVSRQIFGGVFDSISGAIGSGDDTPQEWLQFLIDNDDHYKYRFICNNKVVRPHNIKNIWEENE